MADVLSLRRRGFRRSWTGALFGLAGLWLLIDPSPAAGRQTTTKGQATAKAGSTKGAAEDETAKDAAPAPDVAGDAAPDPSKTQRVAPVEIFTDPNVESIIDIKALTTLPPVPFTNQDLLTVKDMAANPNSQSNPTLIDRVVKGLAAQLTDRRSITSLLEGPPEDAPKADAKKGAAAAKKRAGDGGKGIQKATTDLLEPIYLARGVKNDTFLKDYRRSLQTYLPPLLKNHLIPRVQAMIVLGEAASPTQEALQLFQSEINSKTQSLWVKLWAIEGINNIRKGGGRFGVDQESKAARTIANFLENQKQLPWPLQLRGLETLGTLRHGTLPTEPSKAQMANTAMLFLTDAEARLEVRAEAARALGLMQVNAVPRYNFRLVANAAGLLAADLASEINELYSDSPPRALNETKARYLVALLVGPVYQCFDGVTGESNSGILLTGKADTESLKYIQKVFGLLRPLAQNSVGLLGAPSKEYKKRKEELAASIAALRSFLTQNPPPSRRLVEGGREYGSAAGDAAGVWNRPRSAAVAGVARGR